MGYLNIGVCSVEPYALPKVNWVLKWERCSTGDLWLVELVASWSHLDIPVEGNLFVRYRSLWPHVQEMVAYYCFSFICDGILVNISVQIPWNMIKVYKSKILKYFRFFYFPLGFTEVTTTMGSLIWAEEIILKSLRWWGLCPWKSVKAQRL